MSEKGALAYWFDIATEVQDEWLDWYLGDDADLPEPVM